MNGYKVKEVKNHEVKAYRAKEGLPNLECYCEEWDDVFYLDIIEIKTILTHEQFEQNCYRLEE